MSCDFIMIMELPEGMIKSEDVHCSFSRKRSIEGDQTMDELYQDPNEQYPSGFSKYHIKCIAINCNDSS